MHIYIHILIHNSQLNYKYNIHKICECRRAVNLFESKEIMYSINMIISIFEIELGDCNFIR